MHAQHQLLYISVWLLRGRENKHTELQLSGPHSLGWVDDKTLRKITLNTTDHVMVLSFPALADNSKGVVLHDRGTTDSAQETLLHPAVETENGDFGRWLKPYVSPFRAKNYGGPTISTSTGTSRRVTQGIRTL